MYEQALCSFSTLYLRMKFCYHTVFLFIFEIHELTTKLSNWPFIFLTNIVLKWKQNKPACLLKYGSLFISLSNYFYTIHKFTFMAIERKLFHDIYSGWSCLNCWIFWLCINNFQRFKNVILTSSRLRRGLVEALKTIGQWLLWSRNSPRNIIGMKLDFKCFRISLLGLTGECLWF